MRSTPVIPVVVLNQISDAIPLAEALMAGGLHVIELTLRTPIALEALKEIKDAFPEIIIGAGTVITVEDVDNALKAGADFIVSPGSTLAIIDEALKTGANFLPGASSATESMQLLERGITTQKFFPAEASGGVAMLKALNGPLPQIKFCPTGGISPENARDYLDCDNVVCVGGSWMVKQAWLKQREWSCITDAAKKTILL